MNKEDKPTNHCMKAWTNTKFQIKENNIHMDIAFKPKKLNIGWLHYEVKKFTIFSRSKGYVNFTCIAHNPFLEDLEIVAC